MAELPSPHQGRGEHEPFQECGARWSGVTARAVHTKRGHEPWKQGPAQATEQSRKEVRGQASVAQGQSASQLLEMTVIMGVFRSL